MMDRGDRLRYFGVRQVFAMAQALLLTGLALAGILNIWSLRVYETSAEISFFDLLIQLGFS